MDLLVCLEHNPSNDGHMALGEQLRKISGHMSVSIDVVWKHPMESVGRVPRMDGVIVPNGPTPSFEGQVLCCKAARESGIPLLGICGGLQAEAVDVARHLASLPEANSVEYAPTTPVPVVHEDERLCIRTPQAIRLISGTYLAKLYGSEELEGIVRCQRYVNGKYWSLLEQAGLELLATSADDGRILAFRLLHHPFYVGVAYLPQLSGSDKRPEPLLTSFLREVTRRAKSL